MKKLILLIILLELWHNGKAQKHGGAEQYYSMGDEATFNVVPIIYCETGRDWFVQGRYNYEALQSFSVYAGRTFEKKAAFSYSASPLVGAVLGKFKGGSIGMDTEADYRKCFFSSQMQYTFSLKDRRENFTYSWSDISYQALSNFCAGFSFQHTSAYDEDIKLEKGIFIKALFDKWAVPLYVFSPSSKERYFVIGLSCNW